MNSYQFFKQYTVWCYDPKTETEAQGRARNARALAKAERKARDKGYSFAWEIDPETLSSDWIDDNEDGGRNRDPWRTWACDMYDSEGEVRASLGGIDFGRDGDPWGDPYKRVVEAELSLEIK